MIFVRNITKKMLLEQYVFLISIFEVQKCYANLMVFKEVHLCLYFTTKLKSQI